MNNKLLIGIGVVVALAIGFGLFMMGGSSPAGNEAMTQRGSLKSLLAGTSPQQCALMNAAGENYGTTYVADGKMRGDFTSTEGGNTVQMHMIVSGATAHMWGDAMADGITMSLDAVESAQNNQNQSVDINEEVDYRCEPWQADANRFTLPSGVNFVDMSGMMGQMMDADDKGMMDNGQPMMNSGMEGVQCSACEELPEPGRSQCLAALSCE